MLEIDYSRRAAKFLSGLPAKYARQLAEKITNLAKNPKPNDSKQLKGQFSAYRRATAGEYRIIYRFDATTLYILLVGKRNDDEVYKILERLGL